MSENKKRTPARNDITGAYIESKPPTEEYRKGWERIFGKSKEASPDVQEQSDQTCEDCPQQAEAADSCSESTCAVRSGFLNRN